MKQKYQKRLFTQKPLALIKPLTLIKNPRNYKNPHIYKNPRGFFTKNHKLPQICDFLVKSQNHNNPRKKQKANALCYFYVDFWILGLDFGCGF